MGALAINTDGKVLLDASGKPIVKSGTGSACCLYQARKCSDNTLAAGIYVKKSQFPSYPSTYYFQSGGNCYYVQASDVAACNAGTPVSGQTTVSSCSDSACTGSSYTGCPGNTNPTLPTSVHVGITNALINVGFPSATAGCDFSCIGGSSTQPGWDGTAPLGQVSYGDLCLQGCHYYNRPEDLNYAVSCTDGTCITLEDFCIECIPPNADPYSRGKYVWIMQFLISYDPYNCTGGAPCYYCHAYYSLLGTSTGAVAPTGTYNLDSVDSAAYGCTAASTGNPFPATVVVS